MQELFTILNQIYEALEQILSITQNQTTILIELSNSQDSDEAFNVIYQMMDYKDELINALNTYEAAFEEKYKIHRQKITNKQDADRLKQQVELVLDKKESITTCEKNNLLIMQTYYKERTTVLEIKPNAQNVAMAYKKQQKT